MCLCTLQCRSSLDLLSIHVDVFNMFSLSLSLPPPSLPPSHIHTRAHKLLQLYLKFTYKYYISLQIDILGTLFERT